MPHKRLVMLLRCAALLAPTVLARSALATEPVQDIGIAPPPAGQYPQQQYPQPQYPQQQFPQYQQYPAPYYPPPRSRTYRDGDPVPPGYHVEEKPRSGLVTAGLIMILVPYGIGAFSAIAAKFGNESTWLVAPIVGPWMTMGQRHYFDCHGPNADSLGCVGDVFVTMGLVISGVVQATGGALLLTGVLATKPALVRDDASLKLRPMTVGSGYGVGLDAAF